MADAKRKTFDAHAPTGFFSSRIALGDAVIKKKINEKCGSNKIQELVCILDGFIPKVLIIFTRTHNETSLFSHEFQPAGVKM